MSELFWLRFEQAGDRLATDSPQFFPTVVLLLEALADDDVLRKLAQDALGFSWPAIRKPLCAMTVADLLCLADGTLADVTELELVTARFSSQERIQAECWARATLAARGHGRVPMPECVREIYRSLSNELTASQAKEV